MTCALPGCSKPPWPSPAGAEPHLACGNLHHQLLMAIRFNPALPHPHQQILDRNAAELCALPSCQNCPYPGHSWCSRHHYLHWLLNFTSSLLPEQICKLPGCVRHVFVEINSKPWEFCGWRHHQKYVMRVALKRQQHHLPQQQSLPYSPPSVESQCGQVPSIESRMRALEDYALHGKFPKNIVVDEKFFDKHPWDVCTAEDHTVWLIVRSKFKSKGKRKRVTKDNYHWKQQSGPSGPREENGFTEKYFTYIKLKGKQVEAADLHDECTYSMTEYTIEAVRDCSVIQLRRSNGKRRKGRPVTGNKRYRAEVNNVCSQNTKSDEKAADSFSSYFSPVEDWLDQVLTLSVSTEDC